MADDSGSTKASRTEPGKWIRALRDDRAIKPSDVERITRAVADAKQNPDFYVSHSTLADIEAGSIPSIHKLFSLAICLRVPMSELLLPFDVDPEEVGAYEAKWAGDALTLVPPAICEPSSRLEVHLDANFNPQETTLLGLQAQDLERWSTFSQARVDPVRYRHAVIGSKDDAMGDMLPPQSVVEIDTVQNTVQLFAWRTLRDRPIYLVRHSGGHTCCWCQADGKELILVPHPISRQPVQRFKMPKEATVVGRVTKAWLAFGSVQFPREAAS